MLSILAADEQRSAAENLLELGDDIHFYHFPPQHNTVFRQLPTPTTPTDLALTA